MGAGKAIRKIMIDKHMTKKELAERMSKPDSTVINTLFRDKLTIETALQYGEALGCDLIYVDRYTKKTYKIYID